MARLPKRDFEAVLSDIVSGWSLFRPSRWSHSKGTLSNGYSNPKVDAALDQVRHAVNDDDYRDGVAAFQAAIADDPPSIFLAWSGRSRAVTRRFSVPQPEPGRDVLQTLRSWHPVDTQASRN
jgi:ABC-type transport system substrate-binding protein